MSDPSEGLYPGELRGMMVAGYKVRQRIGAGATGSVHAAIHPSSGRKVAIKVLHPHLAQGVEPLQRFEQQIEKLGALHHPGIIPILELGRLDDGQVFLISEFAKGQPLTDLMAAAGPLGAAEARPLLEAIALTLAIAHGHEVVHGGLTPDNVWATPQEDGAWPPMVRLMDFGMCLLRHAPGTGEAVDEIPYYLSPEQCRGEPPGITSDVYSLGVIAYQLLTGRLPFSSARPAEVIRMHLEQRPRPPSELAPLPPAMDALLLRALAKASAERFQTMWQLRQALPPAEAWPASSAGYESIDVERARQPAASAGPGDAGESGLDPWSDGPVAPRRRPEVIIPPPEPLARALAQRQAETSARAETGARAEIGAEADGGAAEDAAAREAARRRRAALTEQARAELERGEPGDLVRAGGNTSTGVLPRTEPRSRAGALLSAALGLLLAAALGLGAYRLLAGRFPWGAVPPSPDGQLVIETTPAGASVFVNNVAYKQPTPLTIPGLQRGQPYEVVIRRPGYLPWKQAVALGVAEDERLLRVTLVESAPSWGTLHLRASVRADFFLDTRKVGTQTRQVTLAEVRSGLDHRLRVVAPGYRSVEQAVRVEPGKSQVLTFTLQALPR